ncbi:hypothetical protein Tsubulata_048876 [Turnera subulata]|uniref:Uncharacterized protein n=1 Tax=Turnera subulata TaxID=218843 RepID=A0A9Q0FV74_9ROSI|nr:hypothetical protein Tsubulata_048876 [Turnera subulata]
MAVSFSFPIVILCLFVSFHAGLGESQDLVQSSLSNHQVVARPINKHHQLGGGYYLVATVYPFGPLVHWQGECFKSNRAYLTYTQDLTFGTVVITIRSNGVGIYLWRSGIQQKQDEKVMEPLMIGGGGASAAARV